MSSGPVDILVVGGGAAGCVLAARLAMATDASILLLEAGPDVRTTTPGEFRDGWHLPPGFDWGYVAETDGRGVAEGLRRMRALGGSSWLTRFAVRGSSADFDAWAARGNDGWAFDDVLPSFRRLEADAEFGDAPWHGDHGPIPVTRYLDLAPTAIHAAAAEAMAEHGFPRVDDHNRPGAVGVGRMPMSSRNGQRVTTLDAYLPPDGTLPNVAIRGDALVARIELQGSRATGVRLADGSTIAADRVVLCAGTYASPAILMRSGIGPAGHLRSLGIPVRVDLPGVGANLADHPAVDVETGWRGDGVEAPVLHSIATFRSPASAATDAPDLMFWLADPRAASPAFTIDTVLLKPRSRGSVRLRSAEPTDPPVIELPGLREAADVDRLAEAFEIGLEIANTAAVRELCDQPAPPAPTDPAALRETIHAESYSVPHVVGTCAMGPSPADGAVVDASGSVHGVAGLSVVDASIIPEPPSGFPHLVTIMIAERLSERIAPRS
jgi:choline dehydrogenase